MRLTDRFTHSEKRGLLIMLLIMAATVIALMLHTYGAQQPVTVVRDTVTCFVTTSTDSITMTKAVSNSRKSRTARPTADKKATPTRSPLDEPVPKTPQP